MRGWALNEPGEVVLTPDDRWMTNVMHDRNDRTDVTREITETDEVDNDLPPTHENKPPWFPIIFPYLFCNNDKQKKAGGA